MPEENAFEDYPLGPNESRPTLSDGEPLVVRHHFYLEVMRLLGNAEGREARYEMIDAAHVFGRCDLLRSALSAVGSSSAELKEADVDMFVMGIVRPFHHNRYYERWLDNVRDAEPAAAQVIRDAAFSFVTAWCHRYGGVAADLTKNGTYVRADRPAM